jgi:hypothetical protein
MRRRTLLVVLAGLAVVGAVGVVMLWPPEDRLTEQNFDQISVGMSRAEVEAILGPPRDNSTGPLQYAGRSLQMFGGSRGTHRTGSYVPLAHVGVLGDQTERVEWRNDRQMLHVYFLPSGRVGEKSFLDVSRIDRSLYWDLVWRAKRQWRRWFPE